MTDIIDETESLPRLKNRRVNPDPEYQFKEIWNLSDDEIKEVREYVTENKKEREELQSEVSEELEAKRWYLTLQYLRRIIRFNFYAVTKRHMNLNV